MIEYHLKYYHTHSGSEHNIENFSFGDLYKFLHLGYTYVKNRENHVWQILKEMPKKLPDNNGYSYDVLNSNNHIFLSSEEINKIATLNYGKEISFRKEKELMEFCVYKHMKHMVDFHTHNILKRHYGGE
mgnify:FL=1|tara:strand:+ start:311 stop:697 length:387 start_codon:yes stop_codon:yes gene_type:complete